MTRVAFFGLLGSGNLGNHGSFEAMLAFLRARHPDAELGCVCAGPEEVERQYGIPSEPIAWYHRHAGRPGAVALKAFGKVANVVRTARWVRRYDVVIVPGMGVLEATIRLRAWGFPYALFLVSLWGRIWGTKVALVNVGASDVRQPAARWFLSRAAGLATYRSYRDAGSLDAASAMGVDTRDDEVWPDLVFALPDPPPAERTGTVAVGVMDFHGTHLERHEADAMRRAYVAKITEFTGWLLEQGHRVELLTGDPADEVVVATVREQIGRTMPDQADRLVAKPALTLGELIEQLTAVDAVVATRFHNVLSALKAGTPVISLGYAAKNDALMADFGLAAYCQPIRTFDVPELIDQFRDLESRRDQLRRLIQAGNARNKELLDRQQAILSAVLFAADRVSAREGQS